MSKLWSWWKWRNTSYSDMAEIHELIVKAARRCAYDLKHAANDLSFTKEPFADEYLARADMWLDIFAPGGDKNYRHRLHRDISLLEMQIGTYQKLLADHGIEDPGTIPF